MNITLLDNSNTLFSSYLRGWERALKIYEEELGITAKQYKTRINKVKK